MSGCQKGSFSPVGILTGEPPARTGRDSAIILRMKTWIYRFVPALDSLRDYNATHFRRDFFAGATVAAVAVPQAMAYASIFGMPVEYGLYTAIVMTAVGALLDSSKQLINGPTNAISIALLSALAVIPTELRIQAAIMMAFLIGCIQTGISLLRLGDLSRYISHSVIIGFTAGASILLVLDQLKNALGLPAKGGAEDHFLVRFYLSMAEFRELSIPTLIVSSFTILVALSMRLINRRFKLLLPELLVAIIGASLLVFVLKLDERGVKMVGKVPQALPGLSAPVLDWSMMRSLSGSATAIALLGLLEAIAMAKSIAAKTGQKLDINQQCLSEGLANLSGSFFQCFPGSGSLTRSYINHQSGAATQWSGVICAGFVALTLVGLGPLAQFLPRAALAGVLLVTATRMIDLPALKYYCKATRFDLVIVAATALSAVCISVEFCILIGLLLSFLFYVPRAARVEITELSLTAKRIIRERLPQDTPCGYLKIYNLEGEFFFGSAPELENLLQRIEGELPATTKVLLLRIKHLRNPDAVCLHLLEKFIHRVDQRGIQVGLTGVREDMLKALVNVGIVEHLTMERIFCEVPEEWSSTMSAVHWAYQQIGPMRCDHCPHAVEIPSDEADWHFMI